jgi:hypothetical protein
MGYKKSMAFGARHRGNRRLSAPMAYSEVPPTRLNLQRLDLDFTELDHALAVLQRDRAARVF